MNRKPLLVFSTPTTLSRTRKPPFGLQLNLPPKENQIEEFENKITTLDRVLSNRTAYLSANSSGFTSEMILVFEIAGSLDDFYKAVSKTPGMEFLGESQTELEPSEHIYYVNNEREKEEEKKVDSRVFLTMTNKRALEELLSYWREYKKDKSSQDFRIGVTKFRNLFEQLTDVRPYGVEDRLYDTNIEDYIEGLREFGGNELFFEIEMVCKNGSEENSKIYREVQNLLNENNGEVVSNSYTLIPEIKYHAVIAKAPISCFDILTEETGVSFLKCQKILFFRPVGQTVFKKELLEEEEQVTEIEIPKFEVSGSPAIALLDGFPLQNHNWLDGRLIIDDPDNFEATYSAEHRNHGTAMASLILNGDLNNGNRYYSKRPIYVRPIMKLAYNNGLFEECLPVDTLPIDIIHRAVKRIFEGDSGEPSTGIDVKIINLSIGDLYRPFLSNMSTWSKLLDWLSFKYDVLFIVSAGNYTEDLILDVSESRFNELSPKEIQKLVLEKIVQSEPENRILSPAESINAVTVGSSHDDYSESSLPPSRLDVILNNQLLSPVSRVGFGHNVSIKPDILMPGGKKLFRKSAVQRDPNKTHLRMESFPVNSIPPGNLVALPGQNGEFDLGYLCGTSNSAALATNFASQLYEMLLALNEDTELINKIDPKYFSVIIKSLIAHGASWNEAKDLLSEVLQNNPSASNNTSKRYIYPYIGYGLVNTEKVLYCTDRRVTLIGFGELTKDNGAIFSFPLPNSIGQQNINKRLITTLAWMTPLNFNTKKYRQAHLYIDNLQRNDHIAVNRNNYYDYRIGQKGTLQHDILEGDKADTFIDNTDLNIKVNCREDASGLGNVPIKYALCVTLELNENVETEIYEEIKLRLKTRVQVTN